MTPSGPLTARRRCPDGGGVVAYAVWGGVPRNWELAADYDSTGEAVAALILDRNGVLHGEPLRILLDDMRSPVQSNSLLALIGAGCHRLSEIGSRVGQPATNLSRPLIGSRVGQPATNLSRPLSRLIDLGYVRRELPFGESTRSTKRSLYRLDDPFLLFWYQMARDSVVEPLGLRSTACAGTLLHAGGARAPAASRWKSTSSLNRWTGATCWSEK